MQKIARVDTIPESIQPYLDWIESRKQIMVERLLKLVSINSHSHNLKGLAKVMDHLIEMFGELGGKMEKVPLKPHEVINDDGSVSKIKLGDVLRIVKRPNAVLRVLFCGHMDTVFPIDHPFQSPILKSDTIIQGPGVADLKGGLMIMHATLSALERSPWAKNIGWELIINPDEEIGSPGSAKLLDEAARRHHLGLVYEPPLPDGSLVSTRKGTGTFTVIVRGRSAHAGRDFHEGRNAICAMAEIVKRVYNLNAERTGVTLNSGFIHGGGPPNVVPDFAIYRVNIRTSIPEDEMWAIERIGRIIAEINAKEGIAAEIHGGFTRKPKLFENGHDKLFRLLAQCGQKIGLKLAAKPSGGCCDGNNLAAAGLPNIDTMGIVGGQIHTADEYASIDSLTSKAKLGTLLLIELASGKIHWHTG